MSDILQEELINIIYSREEYKNGAPFFISFLCFNPCVTGVRYKVRMFAIVINIPRIPEDMFIVKEKISFCLLYNYPTICDDDIIVFDDNEDFFDRMLMYNIREINADERVFLINNKLNFVFSTSCANQCIALKRLVI